MPLCTDQNLKNKYHKCPTGANKVYKKHRNFCVSLLRKEKKKYYNGLDLTVVEDNRKFWKNIKPLFTGKSKSQANITLVENEQIITEKVEIAEKLNNYFIEAVQNLEIEMFNTSGEKKCKLKTQTKSLKKL